jgi:DNA-binding transcriptional regulator GbsR (MarR family)
MKLEDAKTEFIQTWGSLGSAWGISRSMAQIHALLLTSATELSTEEVMKATQLSRGNVNINLRELINWRLVSKQNRLGERKEFFSANYDIWSVAQNIARERKERELQPVQALISALNQVPLEGKDEEVAHFKTVIRDLHDFVTQMDQLSELLLKLKGVGQNSIRRTV